MVKPRGDFISTFIVGFIPPDSINVGSHHHYIVVFSSGMVLMILPAILIIAVRRLAK